MNSRQEAKLTMYRATEKHCDDFPSITSAVPAFQTAFNEFKAKIAAVISTTQLKDVPLKGIADDKGISRQMLCRKAADVATIMYAFASANSNNTLKQEMNFSFSKLLRTSDDRLAPRCQNIHDKANANLAAAKDYGITIEILSDLQIAINDFSAKTPQPRTAASIRKTLTGNLRELIKEADAILKDRLDRLVVNFTKTEPDFVRTYESNRIIIDPKTTTTQLKGTVTAKSDGQPVKSAKVTIVELSKSVTTGTDGKYTFKPVPHGEYTITVKATGYQDFQADDVEIKLGEINSFDVKLVNN